MKKSIITAEEVKELYDKDFYLWAKTNAELIKEGLYELVDWEKVAEEIEAMGRAELRSLRSYLVVLLEHLYKWERFKGLTSGGEERGGYGWKKSIKNARRAIRNLLEESPSLKVKVEEELPKAWLEAREDLLDWLEENGYNPEAFKLPEDCPYTFEEAMQKELSL
jgi:hypothetical protein